MTSQRLDLLESWGWRMVMPSLLFGGTAVGWVLIFLALCRTIQWLAFLKGRPFEWRSGGVWWLVYFAGLILGGAWSADIGAWAWSLEVKSSLWFFPVILAMPGRRVDSDFWWSVGWSLSFYLLWRLLRAGWMEFALGMPGEWTYARFSGDVHPTYLGLHATVAFLGLGTAWAQKRSMAALWLLTALLSVSIGLSGSKAGILAAMAVALMRLGLFWLGRANGACFEWNVQWPIDCKRWVLFLIMLVLTSVGASSARFVEMETAAAAVSSRDAEVNSSSAGRVAVWRTSLDILRDCPFGVGTGDVERELMLRYQDEGLIYAADRRLNPHNQWLQAGVALGWPGMLIFSLALFAAFKWAYRSRQGLALFCTILILCHAAFESVLEVQRGVVFIMWMLMAMAPSRNEWQGVDR